MAAPLKIIIPIECGGEPHEAELTREGELRLLNHPSIEMMQSFIAFGARTPECLEGWEVWQQTPTAAVMSVVEDFGDESLINAILARDFAQRAAELAPKVVTKLPLEILAIVSQNLHRDWDWKSAQAGVMRQRLAQERKRIDGSIGGRGAWASQQIAWATSAAVRALQNLARGNWSNTQDVEDAQRYAANATAVYTSDVLRPGFTARSHGQRVELLEDPEFIKGYEKHVEAQRRHIARVLYAYLEGKPWPSF
jgi:hypothetical protein